jgi:hypothetical protein
MTIQLAKRQLARVDVHDDWNVWLNAKPRDCYHLLTNAEIEH